MGLPASAAEVLEPLVRVVDVRLGEAIQVSLHDGSSASLKLLEMEPSRDSVLGAISGVRVVAEVNGVRVSLGSGNYHLPLTVAGVQIDCPVTRHYRDEATMESWGLEADARFRLWPAGSPLVRPDTFDYPLRQRWLASETWLGNQGVSLRDTGKIYYHSGIDLGGAEGLDEVFSMTDGEVVSLAGEELPMEPGSHPNMERNFSTYATIWIRDARNWYYYYTHLNQIDPALRLGGRVRRGQRLGLLGKESDSGGWAHLHVEIKSRQPSGKWGTQAGYAFLMEAYRGLYSPALLAVARPGLRAKVGEEVLLDGSRSWSAQPIRRYTWTLTDGSTREGVRVRHSYGQPGNYQELLRIEDEAGNVSYDFSTVRVRADGESVPGPHAAFFPSLGIKPGDPVTFLVRTRGVEEGLDVWDFGDGSPAVAVRSNPDSASHAPDGYARTQYRCAKPGIYFVKVERTNEHGHTGTGRLWVEVETPGN